MRQYRFCEYDTDASLIDSKLALVQYGIDSQLENVMKDKFVLWRFVGLKIGRTGTVGVQRYGCYWKVHGVFESVDDAIVEIDRVHSKNRSKLTDASWLVTLNWKVQFDTLSVDGYMGGIYTEACLNYLRSTTNTSPQGNIVSWQQ